MVFAMDGWYTYTIIIGARNQHTASGAYEFHIHRAYIIYDVTDMEALGGLHASSLSCIHSIYNTEYLISLILYLNLLDRSY